MKYRGVEITPRTIVKYVVVHHGLELRFNDTYEARNFIKNNYPLESEIKNKVMRGE